MITLGGKIKSLGYDEDDDDMEFVTIKFTLKRDSEDFGKIVDAFRDSLIVYANVEFIKENLKLFLDSQKCECNCGNPDGQCVNDATKITHYCDNCYPVDNIVKKEGKS